MAVREAVHESANLRIAVIDPSIFTPPYDQALCESLRATGLDVQWLGRRPRPDDAVSPQLMQPEPYFYGLTERLRRRFPESLVLPVKAVEHTWQALRLSRYLKHSKFSIAHFQWTPVPFVDQFAIRRIQAEMPVVLTVHDTEVFHGNASHPLQRKGWGRVLARADEIIVHIDSAAQNLADSGIDKARIHVIPHPAFPGPPAAETHTAKELHPPRALGFDEGRVNFLLFGRLAPYKGLDVLLDAVAGMAPEHRARIRVVLAGKPAFDVDGFQLRIDSLGLGDCLKIVPRFLSQSELIAYLDAADVLLFPYLDIDASGALMQALPFQPAIIASEIGIFAELLTDGRNAVLVESGNALSLRRAIELVAGDGTLRRHMSLEVSRLVEGDLSWSRAAEATRKVYEKALGQCL